MYIAKPHIQAYRNGGALIYVMYAGYLDWRVIAVADSLAGLVEVKKPPSRATRLRQWLIKHCDLLTAHT